MKNTNKRKNKLLALLLSAMMVSSLGAAFAACGDESDSSSSSSSSSTETSSKTDEGIIKNSNFDFTTLSDTTVIGTSVTGWSRSVNSASTGTAASSKSASGVIDTEADAWKYMTARNYTDEAIKAMSDATAIKDWDKFTAGDKLAFYDAWEERNKDGKISTDFEKYESLNIDAEDIPDIENPGTHANDLEDSQILMLHNNYTIGTAQKYTSSTTVTVEAGTSAKFSVWVKTVGLTSFNTEKEEQDAVGKGAYISVTNSVGGSSLAAYEVKNINTENANPDNADNGWMQYTFYLKGSSYASTTFSLVLGLGQSGGTDHLDYVNGYAFFDDIQCERISNEEYDSSVNALDAKIVKDTVDITAEKIDKTVDVYKEENQSYTTFAMDYYGDAEGWATVYENIFADIKAPVIADCLTVEKNGTVNQEINKDKDLIGSYTIAQLKEMSKDNAYLKAIHDKFLVEEEQANEEDTYFIPDDQEIYTILSTNGAAYTVESPYTFQMDKDVDYMALSFYVKTSDLSNGTGLGVSLADGLKKTSFSSLNTFGLMGVTLGDDEDAYDGWQKCYFFITKTDDLLGKDAQFSLSFTYGLTDINISTTKDSFVPGFAALTNFQTYEMSKLEYASAQTGTYAQKVTLVGDTEAEASGNSGFDSAQGVPTNALEVGLANLQNYKGVYSNSLYVKYSDNGNRDINTYANAGLLNKEYFADYYTADSEKDWLNGIYDANKSSEEVWNELFGTETTQPLFIWNDGKSNDAYGFIGNSATIAADSYVSVSLRVKTSKDATASIYLIDMSEESANKPALSIGNKLTYWYDDEGNVYSDDSVESNDPNNKKSISAFKLQPNGLYLANSDWKGYSALENKTAYYANLSAYTKNDNGDLVAASDSAMHSYYDYTWDREVFYLYNDNYYTEKNGKGDLVLDFTSVESLKPRYEASEDNKYLQYTDICTNDEWAYVTFYIHTGTEAKNYRLEVWSGSRDNSKVNPKNSYVMFDTNNPGTASENFDALLNEYKDLDGAESFESVYSYYDTDQYVRYNKDLDTNLVGNLYVYTASTYTEGTAYLAYLENGNRYNMFADYALSEQTVVATEKSDDDNENTSSNSSDNESTVNGWMLVSSILLAAVLLLVIILIIVRKALERIKKKNGAIVRKAASKVKKEKVVKNTEKKVDEDSPYND